MQNTYAQAKRSRLFFVRKPLQFSETLLLCYRGQLWRHNGMKKSLRKVRISDRLVVVRVSSRWFKVSSSSSMHPNPEDSWLWNVDNFGSLGYWLATKIETPISGSRLWLKLPRELSIRSLVPREPRSVFSNAFTPGSGNRMRAEAEDAPLAHLVRVALY